MLYPGSVGLLQKAMRPMLQQGQARLIEEVKVQTINECHSMYCNLSTAVVTPFCFYFLTV